MHVLRSRSSTYSCISIRTPQWLLGKKTNTHKNKNNNKGGSKKRKARLLNCKEGRGKREKKP